MMSLTRRLTEHEREAFSFHEHENSGVEEQIKETGYTPFWPIFQPLLHRAVLAEEEKRRAARISRIKQQIRQGTYHINATQVASAMLHHGAFRPL